MSKIKIVILVIIVISGFSIYVMRGHFGYVEYLYRSLSNTETRQLKRGLLEILKNNPNELFVEFKKSVEMNSESLNSCHGIAHVLGHESYELYGFETSMQIARPYCGAGFIHGVLEARFHAGEGLDTISNICQEQDQKCNHGLGHGVMVLTKNKFEEALSYCDTLSMMARSDCYDGVFMQIFDDEETGISKKITERREEVALCQRVHESYKTSCYFYVPRIFAQEESMAKDSKNLCNQIEGEDQQYKKVCVVGSGVMIGKYLYASETISMTECLVFGDESNLCTEGVDMYRNETF